MRILNRPMFKYGGPIKEGVMHGMRNGGRAALVGNPVYPQTGGREHHVKYIKDIPKYIKPGYWGGYVRPGTLGGKVKDWWLRNKPTSIPKWKGGGELYKKPFTQVGPTPAWKRGLSWMKANPVWTGTGAFYGAAPVYGAAKLIKEKGPAALDYISEALIPEWAEPALPQNWPIFNKEDKEKLTADAKAKAAAGKVPGHGDAGMTYTKSAEDLAKDQQKDRIKSYLDMMGYDQAKKGALSKALIDASAVVQQGTEEAGSLKEADWGKLINKMIQTTSKRLEKPEQIREAVGLMATKAAIEKDLEDPQVKALRALSIKEKEKVLQGTKASSIGDLVLLSKKASGKKRADAEVMKDVMSIKEPDIIATIVGKKDDLADIKDLKDFTTVEDFIVKKYKGKQGIYIIDNVVVQIYPDGTSDQLH